MVPILTRSLADAEGPRATRYKIALEKIAIRK